MIHVLQVTGSLRVGGLETVAMNCMRYADKAKYQIDFLVFGNQIGEYEEEAIKNGCKVIHIESPRKNYLRYYKEVCRVLQESGPYDIVHSHVFFNSGVVMLAANKCGVPVRIAHAHSVKRASDKGPAKLLFQHIMRRLLVENATEFCACSQQAGEYVFTSKVFREKGMVLPNIIDTKKFEFSPQERASIRKELKIDDDCIVVGQVGHLTAAKNQSFLLKVFAEYKKINRSAVLLLVGDGELKAKLEQEIEILGLKDEVRLTGTRTDVGALLSAMDVYVCTSTNEGFGITLLEAAANGLRIVVEQDVLVDELKKVVPYQCVEGFDIHKWVRRVSDTAFLGRESKEVIRNSIYTVDAFCQRIKSLYSMRS